MLLQHAIFIDIRALNRISGPERKAQAKQQKGDECQLSHVALLRWHSLGGENHCSALAMFLTRVTPTQRQLFAIFSLRCPKCWLPHKVSD